MKRDLNKFLIAESLQNQEYKFLWDILFANHPNGQLIKGKWLGQGENKTEVPSKSLLIELLNSKPIVLILDEFQTWYEGLTNTKQFPWQKWAFNHIQILSEIAEENPELLSLVVSFRDGDSDAAEQIYRINHIKINFKGAQAKKDRQNLLLHRIFENRLQVPNSDIETSIKVHVDEYIRLNHISGSDHEKYKKEFIDAWPFSPKLMQLLEDQVLVATSTQETRDLIRILIDVFKGAGDTSPVLTAADFNITKEERGIGSLLDSVANRLHKDLSTKALRNLEAVREACPSLKVEFLEDVLSALWLRSLSLEKHAGARHEDLQLDITRKSKIDDNKFQADLAMIEANSFNIHRSIGGKLVFLNEENPQAKLMAHAKIDRLFSDNQDIDHLALEIKHVLADDEGNNNQSKIIVLKKNWENRPWENIDEKEKPESWGGRIPHIVIPKGDIKQKDLGVWLKTHISKNKNTVRFILAKEGVNIFFDKSLLIPARIVYLAKEWKDSDASYRVLYAKFQKELREQLKNLFDRFAILEVWNFGQPELCQFQILRHNEESEKIIPKIQEIIKKEVFEPEGFEEVPEYFEEEERNSL